MKWQQRHAEGDVSHAKRKRIEAAKVAVRKAEVAPPKGKEKADHPKTIAKVETLVAKGKPKANANKQTPVAFAKPNAKPELPKGILKAKVKASAEGEASAKKKAKASAAVNKTEEALKDVVQTVPGMKQWASKEERRAALMRFIRSRDCQATRRSDHQDARRDQGRNCG